MWKTIGRWTLGMAGAVMLTVPALGARADESRMKNDAAQAGQQAKSAGESAGNAAEGAWSSSKNAAQSAGNTAEEAGHRAAAATNNNTPNNAPPISDDWITSQVKQKLSAAQPSMTNVDVRTKKDVVTLSGNVTSEAARTQAVDIARQIDGVKQVKDHIEVNPGD